MRAIGGRGTTVAGARAAEQALFDAGLRKWPPPRPSPNLGETYRPAGRFARFVAFFRALFAFSRVRMIRENARLAAQLEAERALLAVITAERKQVCRQLERAKLQLEVLTAERNQREAPGEAYVRAIEQKLTELQAQQAEAAVDLESA